MLWLKLGWRNLRRNRRRTAIEILTVAGSVFFAVFANNVAVGTYDKMINDGVRMGSGHIGIYRPGYLEDRRTERVMASPDLVTDLVSLDGVEAVYPRLTVPGIIRSARDSRPAGCMGLDLEREKGDNPILAAKRLISGALPASDDKRGVILGETLARELGLEVGGKGVIMAQDVNGEVVSTLIRVSGIVKTGVKEIDAAAVILPRARLGALIGAENAAHEIAVILPDHHNIRRTFPVIEATVAGYADTEALTWEEAMPELASYVRMDYTGFQVMVFILYIIVGIGTVNTLLMSVMERTREFGVFRAMGLKKTGIRSIVVAEAFVLACVGVVVGALAGLAASLYTATRGIDFTKLMGGEQGLGGTIFDPVLYSGWEWMGTAFIMGAMIIVAVLASLYPAHHVMKVQPSEAMRVY